MCPRCLKISAKKPISVRYFLEHFQQFLQGGFIGAKKNNASQVKAPHFLNISWKKCLENLENQSQCKPFKNSSKNQFLRDIFWSSFQSFLRGRFISSNEKSQQSPRISSESCTFFNISWRKSFVNLKKSSESKSFKNISRNQFL